MTQADLLFTKDEAEEAFKMAKETHDFVKKLFEEYIA